MMKQAYIGIRNVGLETGEMVEIALELAECIIESNQSSELIFARTSLSGRESITEGFFDRGLLQAWLARQNSRTDVAIKDFFEPMTIPGNGKPVIVHKTRHDAAAADARKYMQEDVENWSSI